jgi:hypothetical protein
MRNKLPFIVACCCIAFFDATSATARTETAAIFDAGVTAYDAHQYTQAFKLWSSIAAVDAAATRNIAIMLRKGVGVTKDSAKAEALFQVAADGGLRNAQADLAEMLLKGEAGPPDPKRALPLLREAAGAGHPKAQYELGELYEAGQVVRQDKKLAMQYYVAAASQGLTEASEHLKALKQPGSAPGTTVSSEVSIAKPIVRGKDNPASAVDSASGKTGAFAVQIGAYKSLAEANSGWTAQKTKHAALLADLPSDVQKVDLGPKGTWYRLRVVGFSDHKVASDICEALKADATGCFLANDGRSAGAK